MTTTGLILLLIAVICWGYYARMSLKFEMERNELRHQLKELKGRQTRDQQVLNDYIEGEYLDNDTTKVVFWDELPKAPIDEAEPSPRIRPEEWVRGQTDRLGDGCKQVVYHEFGHILVGHDLQGCYYCKN